MVCDMIGLAVVLYPDISWLKPCSNRTAEVLPSPENDPQKTKVVL